VRPAVLRIKPRKIHQLFLGLISFHFQIIRLRPVGTSRRSSHLNGSTDPKSLHADNLGVTRTIVSTISPTHTSLPRAPQYPAAAKPQPQSVQSWPQSSYFFFTDPFCHGSTHIAGRLKFSVTPAASLHPVAVNKGTGEACIRQTCLQLNSASPVYSAF